MSELFYSPTNATHETPGSWAQLTGGSNIQDLKPGMDFRRPEYRREVFLRFYEFHLKYRSHPGGVYFLMRYLSKLNQWNIEERLWYAFLNGNTQHPPTSLLFFRRFPDFHKLATDSGEMDRLDKFYNTEFKRLEFDTDRRHQKSDFMDSVKCYAELTKGDQENFFAHLCDTSDRYANFRKTWEVVREKFYSFGRLSTFSYLEYLRIMRIPLNCDNLFLEDLSGSKSHRNGLAKVLGRDDLDWHDSNPTKFAGKYTPEMMDWLKLEARYLLEDAALRFASQDFLYDVNYFTLESTFCTFKSWFRPNRRYPNVYMDMLYNRIKKSEERWPEENFSVFWDARKQYLPPHLRLEDNPGDPGLKKEKQNHFRQTGQVIMMDQEWPCFSNDFNRKVDGNEISNP